ncbi:DUF3857 domain-containing protein [Flammeovirga pectinis]|uniref:DUF3857 domain-containing protein n=1 Tax=Flammeovirga pectinis TaxID=2494373 RepID=A0A3S9P003_9BACT|nr:DUF3857 domain-containing protein [Flammeovirga pectinis]AZQ61480.1 DUF3857 domain-containing protein [Flammeovirga pectinis]
MIKITPILLITLVLLTNMTLAQKKLSRTFKKISKVDMDYQSDSVVDAVILFDIGEVEFIENHLHTADIRLIRTKRIKILTEEGVKYAQAELSYFINEDGRSEDISRIDGFVYNYEGKKIVTTKLDRSTIYDKKVSRNFGVKKVVFPKIKVGSILEYKYTHYSPFYFRLPSWTFQDIIPTVYSEYFVKLIPNITYLFSTQNINKFTFKESKVVLRDRNWGGKEMGHKFILTDIPAFSSEEYMTNSSDYLKKIIFQLNSVNVRGKKEVGIFSSWGLVNKVLEEDDNFGEYINLSKELGESILPSLIEKKENKKEIAKIIIEFVKNNYKWNGSLSKYTSQSLESFNLTKAGNVADINLFLIGLLKAANIEVSPVLLGTKGNGKIITNYPYTHLYNYVIPFIEINGEMILSDASEKLLPYNILPTRCFNGKGIVVNQKEDQWIDINDKSVSKIINKYSFALNFETLNARVNLNTTFNNYFALNMRKLYANDSILITEEALNNGFISIDRFKTYNYHKNDRSYRVLIEGDVEINKTSNLFSFKPFLNCPIQFPKLTLKDREYPIDLDFVIQEHFEAIIPINEGYKVISEFFEKKVDNDIGTFSYKVEEKNGVMWCKLFYRFKSSYYTKNQYLRLKMFYDLLNESIQVPLVFSNKESN